VVHHLVDHQANNLVVHHHLLANNPVDRRLHQVNSQVDRHLHQVHHQARNHLHHLNHQNPDRAHLHPHQAHPNQTVQAVKVATKAVAKVVASMKVKRKGTRAVARAVESMNTRAARSIKAKVQAPKNLNRVLHQNPAHNLANRPVNHKSLLHRRRRVAVTQTHKAPTRRVETQTPRARTPKVATLTLKVVTQTHKNHRPRKNQRAPAQAQTLVPAQALVPAQVLVQDQVLQVARVDLLHRNHLRPKRADNRVHPTPRPVHQAPALHLQAATAAHRQVLVNNNSSEEHVQCPANHQVQALVPSPLVHLRRPAAAHLHPEHLEQQHRQARPLDPVMVHHQRRLLPLLQHHPNKSNYKQILLLKNMVHLLPLITLLITLIEKSAVCLLQNKKSSLI